MASASFDRLSFTWYYLSIIALSLLSQIMAFIIFAGMTQGALPSLRESADPGSFLVKVGVWSSWFFELNLSDFNSELSWAVYYISKGGILGSLVICLLFLKYTLLKVGGPSLEKVQWALIFLCLSFSKALGLFYGIFEYHLATLNLIAWSFATSLLIWVLFFQVIVFHIAGFILILIGLGGISPRFYGFQFKKWEIRWYTKNEGIESANRNANPNNDRLKMVLRRTVAAFSFCIFVIYGAVVYKYWNAASLG